MSPKSFTYDPDAQAYFNANTAITSPSDKNAINNFYLGLKSDGIYSKLKAMYLPIWGSAATCKWNLVNPLDTNAAFRLTFATGWSFSSGGITPNGTSAYANTFLTPNINLINNNSHISVYLRTNTDNNGVDIGIQDDMGPGTTQSAYYIITRILNTLVGTIQTNDANRIIGSNTDSRGFYITSRTTSTSLKQYKNSSIFGTNTNTSTGTRARYSIPLGAIRYINDLGSDTYSDYSNRQQCFASIGDGLTDTDASNFYNRVQTLMTYFAINV
jgi:hypothetical protein